MSTYTPFTITHKFTGTFIDRIDNIHNHSGGYVDLPQGQMIYGSRNAVKERARQDVAAFVETAIANAENRERAVIRCKDGTVLIVQYDRGWEYRIASDRSDGYATGVSFPANATFKTTLEAATNHAEQCFGGTALLCRY